MSEQDKIREILAELPPNKRLFRINAGMGWIGQTSKAGIDLIAIKNPRPLQAAPKGWPDLCGWETVEITPDMVGKYVAVFVGEEVKLTGKLSKEQAKFRDVLTEMGGIFRIHRD
jgi:hypothetical protein